MSGSFWKFSNGLSSLSNISTLLENHSNDQASNNSSNSKTYDLLMKLLEENDLLQELLSNNSMLLEFLREEEVLSLLVDLVIEEGNIDDSLSTDVSKLKLDSKGYEPGIEKVDDKDISERNKKNDKKDNLGKKAHDAEDEKHVEEDEDENQDDEKDDEEDDAEDEENDDDDDEEENAETDNETAEDRAVRHATLAAEILSADVWSLTDTVMESTENLNKLWSVLDSKKPLSINLSTYFMKIMEHLLDMKCDEMIAYLIDNQPNLVKKFINHLSNPPLMDFLLKLISTDKPDNSTGIIDFLQNQDFITHLINSLDITGDDNASENYDILLVKQSSAADFLKALITISANSTTDNSTIGPNELTRELVSYDQMDRLCKIMLKGGYALANGVGIIIEIIRKNNSDYDILPVLYITLESHPPTGRDPIYLGHLLKIFGNKIEDFNKLLMDENSSTNSILKTPFGEIKPLGFERFKICELIAELLHCSNMALLNDNKGFDVVKERDILRNKMKEFDPVSFKYNEVIVLPNNEGGNDDKTDSENDNDGKNSRHNEDDDFANDTIDSFNSKLNHENDTMIQYQNPDQDDEEEPHANANLSEEQIRANPVIGDFLKISLYDTQIISNILLMFFQFPWNNFLHNVVFDIVQQVLNGSMDIGFNKFLAIDLFHYGDITNKIIEGQKLCTDFEDNHNGLRLGFMGHLTLIAEEVVKFIQLYPTHTLSELIDSKVEDEIWEEYVSHVLYDTREKYNAILGGGEDDEEDDDASNTFDEGTGEIIEQNDFKPGLLLDPKTDHDIIGSGFEEGSKDDGHYEENKYHENADTIKSNSSDESSEDDDDHFTNYMSQQLTNTASTEILSSVKSPNDEEYSEKNDSFKRIPGDINIHTENDEMDTDEYIDPNDDGLSYKKSHPLYDAKGSLLSASSREDDEISSEDSSSSSSDSDDEIILDDDNESKINEKGSNGNKLSRSASRS